MSIVRVPAPLAEPVAESVPIPPQGSSTLGESTAPKEGLEGVDPAIADALKAPKNRQTVLRFEEDVLNFLQSPDEALFFPLSLSGYQRLLAHRTAQYHGLQTATVDDGGDDHGKIKATKPQANLEAKPKLADMRIPDPSPEDPKEQPKSVKKKTGERQSKREKEGAATTEASRGGPGSLRGAHEQEFRQHMIGSGSSMPEFSPFHRPGGPVTPGQLPMTRPLGMLPGMEPGGLRGTPQRGRAEELQDFQGGPSRSASMQSTTFSGSEGDPRRQPGFPSRSHMEEHVRAQFPGMATQQRFMQQPHPSGHADASAAQMMGGLSLHHPGEQPAFMHPGMAMPGYGPMQQVPFAYVPSAAGMPQGVPQPLPHMQGMGMYGSPPMPYPGYAVPAQYGFMPGMPARPGQQPMMGPMMGQQPMMPPAQMMPFYPGFLPQGYNMPAMMSQAGMHMAMPQQQMASSLPGRHGSAPPGSPSQTAASGLGYRRVSAPAFTRQTRVNSSSSITSTAHSQRQGGGGGAAPGSSSESASAEATSPSGHQH